MAGALGAGFGYLAYVYLTLPDVRPLATVNPETTAFIELRRGEAHDQGKSFNLRRRWVPYARISTHLKRAVIVAEDSAFFEHEGLDYEQIRESIELSLEEGATMRGASTITQQLAKNLYLSPSRNPVRKLREVLITRRLEAALSKRRIFEIYLNSIEWGDGIFGCEAAARAYFTKGAADLGPGEAALLAGAIINPRVHNPARPTRRLLRRQQLILRADGPGGTAAEPAGRPLRARDPRLRDPAAAEPPPAEPAPAQAAPHRPCRHRRATNSEGIAAGPVRAARLAPDVAPAPVRRWSGARRGPRRGCSGRGRTLRRRGRCRRAKAPGPLVLKNTRSPARTSSRDTRLPASYWSRASARHRPAVLREHVADQPAAIEAVGSRAAVTVGNSAQVAGRRRRCDSRALRRAGARTAAAGAGAVGSTTGGRVAPPDAQAAVVPARTRTHSARRSISVNIGPRAVASQRTSDRAANSMGHSILRRAWLDRPDIARAHS